MMARANSFLVKSAMIAAMFCTSQTGLAQDAPMLPRPMNSDGPSYTLDDGYLEYRNCIASEMSFLADAKESDLLQRIGPRRDDWNRLSAKVVTNCKDERADITRKLDVSMREWREGKFIAKDPVHFYAMNTLSSELDKMDQEFTTNLNNLYEKLSKKNHAQN